MAVYNGLFINISPQVVEMCKMYLGNKCPVNAGIVFQTNRVCARVRLGIQHALQLYNNICPTCSNHDMWIIAGVSHSHQIIYRLL